MRKHRFLTAVIWWVAAFAVCALPLWFTCRYTLWYSQGLATYYYNSEIMDAMALGVTDRALLFIRQFFVSPAAAVGVTAALLATLTAVCAWLLGYVHRPRWVVVAAVIPAALVLRHVCDVDKDTEIINGITAYTAEGCWDKVVDLCGRAPIDDIRVQNCLNVALAEKGVLADCLFAKPCYGTESLLMQMTTPEAFAILNDVYYSMGHISAAQCFAFQANEAYGDFSPRLLKRLADINIIYGNYKVAEKYLTALESTLFYRGWARSRRSLLYDDAAVAAHPELGLKQRCIFPDNRFMAQRGIDDDLLQIVKANPAHTPTLQYLGCMYLLAGDMPRFMRLMDVCRADGTLPAPLPRHFQEAICTAALMSGQRLDKTYDVPSATMEACWDFWTNGTAMPGSCPEYLRSRRAI